MFPGGNKPAPSLAAGCEHNRQSQLIQTDRNGENDPTSSRAGPPRRRSWAFSHNVKFQLDGAGGSLILFNTITKNRSSRTPMPRFLLSRFTGDVQPLDPRIPAHAVVRRPFCS